MTLTAVAGQGLWFPAFLSPFSDLITGGNSTGYFQGFGIVTAVIDLTGEKFAMIGRVFIDGRPTSAKTLSSAGGKIKWYQGARTFATAGSTVRVSVQDVATGTGPPFRPDETEDVSGDLVQGTDTINANTWNTKALSSGSKSIAHGDLIAVVFDFTTRNGADSLTFTGPYDTTQWRGPPGCVSKVGGSWNTNPDAFDPQVVIEFDDGTLAFFDGAFPTSAATAAHQLTNSTNPDEVGLIFQVPWEVKIDALMPGAQPGTAAADFDVKLYSDPLGTPSVMVTRSMLGEQGNASQFNRQQPITLATEITLAANTDYCLSIKANSTGIVYMSYFDVPDANFRKYHSGGTTLQQGTRNNDSGAFSATTTRIVTACVRISQFHDSGSINYTVPRRGGLLRI